MPRNRRSKRMLRYFPSRWACESGRRSPQAQPLREIEGFPPANYTRSFLRRASPVPAGPSS
jgi:hypothetical protein